MSLYDHLIAEGEKRGEARGEKRGTISAIHAIQGFFGLRPTSEKSLFSKSVDELVAMRDMLLARHHAAA